MGSKVMTFEELKPPGRNCDVRVGFIVWQRDDF